MGVSANLVADSGALALFLCSYLGLIITLVGALSLGWALTGSPTTAAWPLPPRYGRAFRLAFLGLLSALAGFPPFFFLAPKLALFSRLIGAASLGAGALLGATLLAGWYVYWQGATGLFASATPTLATGRRLPRAGALALASALLGPLALSGLLLDLWALAQWLA
jgi:hypothetical protein